MQSHPIIEEAEMARENGNEGNIITGTRPGIVSHAIGDSLSDHVCYIHDKTRDASSSIIYLQTGKVENA